MQTVTGKGYRFVATAPKPANPRLKKTAIPCRRLAKPATAPDAELPSQPASYPRSRLWLAVLGALTVLVFLIAAVNLARAGGEIDSEAPIDPRSALWQCFRSTISPAILLRITSPTA